MTAPDHPTEGPLLAQIVERIVAAVAPSHGGPTRPKGIPAAVDIVVWDRRSLESRLHLQASFAATVVREGRLLHAT